MRAIVTCMGRLAHVKRSIPALLRAELPVLLVDYSCPDHCGAWAAREYPQEVEDQRLVVVECPGQRVFNKPKALNAGAARAIELRAKHLCFVDADTIVNRKFGDWCLRHAEPGKFWIIEPAPDRKDLTGLLLIAAEDFERSGGYCPEFVGWGFEELEFRTRLRLRYQLDYGMIPPKLARSIPHSDELRSRYYACKDLRRSNAANFRLTRKRIRKWTGHDVLRLPRPDVRSLLGIYS